VAARKKNLNFLPEDELEKSPAGKFLKWLLGAGRYIVVFTELIVVLTFLARFKLDRELINLHEEISQKQAILASSSDLEKEIRLLQKQLAVIKEKESQSLASSSFLKELAGLTPLDLAFSELRLQPESAVLSGTSLSGAGLATLVQKLKANQHFQAVNLEKVFSEGKQNPALQFRIETFFSAEKD